MHFHLPKPLHGWREFAGEVGIIVIGVLIALSAEQVVEHFRDDARAREASRNVRDEIARDLGAMRSRTATEPCIRRRILELQTYLNEVTNGGHPPQPSWVGRPQVWTIGTARWRTATNTGGSSLLSPDDEAELSSIYESMNEIVVNEHDEQAAWAQLRAVTHVAKIDTPEAAALTQALQTARLSDWRIAVAISQAAELALALHIKLTRNPLVGSLSVCLPMNTPFADGVRRSRMSDVGEPQ